mgnify:CR=1 FL=1|jgi:hypothetical protein
MPDQFTEVTKVGYGKRLMNSIKGIVTGVILFVLSFGVLYWNEGRVDVSDVAVNAVEGDSASVSTEIDGQFVYLGGTLSTTETLGDGMWLNAGDYLALSRNVEMYAWIETSSSESETNMGGSETTETTYTYAMDWTSNPSDASGFKIPEDHFNPTLAYEAMDATVSSATLGAYNVNMDKLSLPAKKDLTLNEEMLDLIVGEEMRGNYVYIPYGFEATGAEVGDVRISYQVLGNNIDGTGFGEVSGDTLVPFVDAEMDNTRVYRFFDGTREEALATMHGEHVTSTWILRLVGFMMMWIGLGMLFEPLSTLLDVLPLFGSLSRGLTKVITFVVALVLSIVTILISMILHNIVALVIAVLLVVAAAVYFLKKKGKEKAAGGAKPAKKKESAKKESK